MVALAASLLFGFSTFTPNQLFAFSKKEIDVHTKSTSNSIKISWEGGNENFELDLFNENGSFSKVWSGNKSEYEIKDLEPGKEYKVKLTHGGLSGKSDYVIVNTSTKKTKSQIRQKNLLCNQVG
ncbi:fibronectin type III domain-containing protein [Salinithrix halophila]|uniref:Fibronectin type III domain-containing protein n=1 Tax=Salinithrix halophila TaxID=1485204 RepID=A0ABV8JFJ3_9BACL